MFPFSVGDVVQFLDSPLNSDLFYCIKSIEYRHVSVVSNPENFSNGDTFGYKIDNDEFFNLNPVKVDKESWV